MRNYFIVIIFCSLVSSLASCDQIQLPQIPPNVPPGLIETQAAQTVALEQTLNAPTSTQTTRPTRALRTPTITNTIVITPTDTPEPTSLPTALFSDDFSTNTGWAVSDREDYAFGFAQGGYFISVDIPKATIWSAKSIEVTDIQIQTQAARLDGPEDGYFGVMCRQQRDGFNYYIFVISTNGSFGIGKVVNGTLNFIQEGVDHSSAIMPGNASNRIVGDCKDNMLTLTVNDKQLLEVEDDEFSKGTIGLVAGLHSGQGLHVLYDYFIVKEK